MINVQNLTYSYPNQRDETIKNLNFTIAKGEIYGIIPIITILESGLSYPTIMPNLPDLKICNCLLRFMKNNPPT